MPSPSRAFRHELRLRVLRCKVSATGEPFIPFRNATDDLKQCLHCGAQARHMPKCAGCRWARYCNRECQKAAWDNHKLSCWPDLCQPCLPSHDTTRDLNQCALCGTQARHMPKCAGCRNTRYCSFKCQRIAWTSHKPICNKSTNFADDYSPHNVKLR